MNLRVAWLALLLLAFLLRCLGLDAQELRGDEAFGYFFSIKRYGEIVEQTLDLAEPHPVASYWLQHAWLAAAGHSEFALRFASTWFSVVAAALLVALARILTIRGSTITVALLIMVVSPYVIWHAQDARMYSMSLALTLGSTVLAVRWWRASTKSWRLGLAYLCVTWLALHTHYFALYMVLAQNLALFGWLWFERAPRRWLVWMGLQGLLLVAWTPWLWQARTILLGYRGNGDSPDLVDGLRRAMSALVMGEAASPDEQVWVATLALATVGMGVIAAASRQKRVTWFLLIYALTPLAATWLSALSRPIFNERYLVAATPPIYLLMALACERHGSAWPRAWVGRAMVVALVGLMVVGQVRQMRDPALSKTRGWRELADVLAHAEDAHPPEALRLVQNYPDPTLWYYYRGSASHLVLPPGPLDRQQAQAEVAGLVASGVTEVVFVEQRAANWDPGGIAEDALRVGYTPIATQQVGRWPVQYWLRAPADVPPLALAYAHGLALTGAHVSPLVVNAGDLLEVYLRWTGTAAALRGQEAISLQLLNRDGQLVAQSDKPLSLDAIVRGAIVPYGILLAVEIPPGDYEVVMILYAPDQPGAPRLLTTTGADQITLATVQVRTR